MKLSRNAALWVGGVTPLAALMILLSFLLFKQSEEAAARQKHTAMTLSVAEAFMSGLKDAETGQRGYLLTGEEAYLEPYQTVRHKLAGQLAQMRQLTQDNSAQQHRLEVLLPLVDEKLALLQQSITLRRDKNTEDALKMVRAGQGEKLMDSIRSIMNEFITLEREAQQKNESAFEMTLRYLKLLIIVVSSFIGVLALVSAYVVYRETLKRLQIQEQAARAITDAQDALSAREEDLSVSLEAHEEKQAALIANENELSIRLKAHAGEHASLQEREEALAVRLQEFERERASLSEREASLSVRSDEVARERDSLVVREEALSMRLGELDQVRASLNAREDGLSARLKEHDLARLSLQEREKALSAKNIGLEQERVAFQGREATLSTTLDLVGDAVLCVDVGGAVSYMNSGAEKLTGWSRDEARGRPVVDVVRIVDRKSAKAPVSLSPLQDNAILLLARDGTECLVTERRSGLGNVGGETAGTAWILHDVTREYAAYQELYDAAMRIKVAEVSRSKTETTTNLAADSAQLARGSVRDDYRFDSKDLAGEPDKPNLTQGRSEPAESPEIDKNLASIFAAMENPALGRNMTDSQRVASALADIFRRLERH